MEDAHRSSLSIHTRPRTLLAPAVRTPKPSPSSPVDEDGHHIFQSEVWERASGFAASYLQRQSPTSVLNLASHDADLLHPAQLGLAKDFGLACTSMEVYNCFSAGVTISFARTPFSWFLIVLPRLASSSI